MPSATIDTRTQNSIIGTENVQTAFAKINAALATLSAPSATISRTRFSAADGNLIAGQTTFVVPAYTPGTVQVFYSGLQTVAGKDFTATNGTTVVLLSGVLSTDAGSVVIEILSINAGGVVNCAPLVHSHTKDQVGLLNVDNTSDTTKSAPGNPIGDAISARALATNQYSGYLGALFPNAVNYLQLTQFSGPKSIFHWIPKTQWQAIINRTSTYDCSLDIDNALASNDDLFFPPGTYIIGAKQISFRREGQRLIGSGYQSTIFYMDYRRSDFVGTYQGYIRPTHFSTIEGVSFTQWQPDTSNRSDLNQYAAIISPSSALSSTASYDPNANAYHVHLKDIVFNCCYVAIDATGNNTMSLDNIHMGIFSRGIVIDGAYDFWSGSGVTFYIYGMTAKQARIYFDGNAIGIISGRCDGFNLSRISSFGLPVQFYGSSKGYTTGNIGVCYMDASNAVFSVIDGQISVGAFTTTSDAASPLIAGSALPTAYQCRGITVNGGQVTIGVLNANHNGGDAVIRISAGRFSVASGICMQQAANTSGLYTEGTAVVSVGPGTMFTGQVNSSGQQRTVAYVVQTADSGLYFRGMIDRRPNDSGPGIVYQTDNPNNYFDSKTISGWTYQIPTISGSVKGSYQ